MASQTTGIQLLLAAEKKAAEKVSEARKRKARRMKQAKEDAQREVDEFRVEREAQFKAHEQQILGSKDNQEQQIKTDTAKKLTEMSQCVDANKEKALSRLLSIVVDISPQLHENYRV